MKKILSSIIACSFLLTSNAFATFKDVGKDDWYYEAVRYVYENNILTGMGDGLFAPKDNMTRAMIVQALYNMEDKPSIIGENTYEDVEKGKWYEDAIIWSSENNLVTGVGNNKFSPNSFITKEQMVTILYNYAKSQNYDVTVGEDTNILSYNDAFELSDYAYSPMQWACGENIISGFEDNLSPKKALTRAEVATIIMNFNNAYPRNDIAWVELKGSISTGYSWVATGYDDTIINVSDYMYFEANDSDNVGQVGNFKFKVKSLKEGKTTITFNYMRPWEEEVLSTVDCNVEVKSDKKVVIFLDLVTVKN